MSYIFLIHFHSVYIEAWKLGLICAPLYLLLVQRKYGEMLDNFENSFASTKTSYRPLSLTCVCLGKIIFGLTFKTSSLVLTVVNCPQVSNSTRCFKHNWLNMSLNTSETNYIITKHWDKTIHASLPDRNVTNVYWDSLDTYT